jgi:hypothetical protein
VTYVSFQFKGTSGEIDSNTQCLKKAKGCVPGKDDISTCSNINQTCKDKLNKGCASSGLSNNVVVLTSPYPPECDYVSKGVEKTSADFLSSCALFIKDKFLKRSLILNPESLVGSTQIVSDAAAKASTTLRLLQTSSLIVQTDPTINYNSFADVTLSSSDIVVDGSTPDSTVNVNTAMEDVSGSSFIQIAFSLLLIFILF